MDALKVFTILVVFCVSVLDAKECTQLSLCSCQFDDGSGIVDITSLANTDNTPAFKDVIVPAEENYYSYNPCVGFTEDNCNDAAVCIINPDKTSSVKIGDPSSASYKYYDDSGELIVGYTSGKSSDLKTTEVQLVCNTNACTPSIVAHGKDKKGELYRLTLTTVCACPNGCSSSGPNNCGGGGGGSAGSHVTSLSMGTFICILMMTFFALFTVLA